MNNIIQIKRRLAPGESGPPFSLSGGEIAFNEVDSVLYYGNAGGGPGNVIGIAGSGLYVDRTTAQTISGVKTFFDTVSALGDVEVDGNVDANTYSINGTEIIDSSRNATFVDIDATGNVTVAGNLSVLGDFTSIDTEVTTTSAFAITNAGSQTAFSVTQTGAQDIAVFQDGELTEPTLIVKDGGKVGINTEEPNKELTVVGSISATDIVYANGGLEVGLTGASTLYVENGKVGINTEEPNEELTVVGDISATGDFYVQDIFANNGDFTGTLTVDSGATFNSTLDVIEAATFASTISAQDAVEFDSTLTVDGAVTFNSTLEVIGATQLDDNTIYTDGTGNLTITGNLSGVENSSLLENFIIDCGSF